MARTLRLVADGIHFAEGPRWRDGRLWFSDFYAHCIYSVSEEGGDMRVEVQLDGEEQSSGLGWMPDGSLLFVKMQAQEVWRRWPDGRLTLHADLSAIATFWCNDMVVDAEGRAYVGNFGFDLDAELSARGSESVLADHPTTPLALIGADGSVRKAAGDERFSFPNGMVITPDGKTLIVGETLAGRLTALDIGANGELSNRRVWAATVPHIPDGICLDGDGAVWIADPLSPACVRIAQGGGVLETVETSGLNCYACILGGEDGRTLFMLVAPSSHRDHASTDKAGRIYACKVDVPHTGWP